MGSYTLLLVLVIDIVYSIDDFILVIIISYLRIIKIFSTLFLDLFQGLDLPAGAFCFVLKIVIAVFTGHFRSSFASYSDLSIYDLLAIMTCLVSEV